LLLQTLFGNKEILKIFQTEKNKGWLNKNIALNNPFSSKFTSSSEIPTETISSSCMGDTSTSIHVNDSIDIDLSASIFVVESASLTDLASSFSGTDPCSVLASDALDFKK